MNVHLSTACFLSVLLALSACAGQSSSTPDWSVASSSQLKHAPGAAASAHVHYLEIVTPNVEQTCGALESTNRVIFSQPIPELGNARTAALKNGGRIGVRAPMRDTELPVVRPYLLVDDIDAAVKAAQAAGGEMALPPTDIAGHGRIAIYVLGGIEHGLWQR